MALSDFPRFAASDFVDEHRELADSLSLTARLLEHRHRTQKSIDHQIWRLVELIESHFAHEEDGGYMADVLSRAPRLTIPVHKLLAEHTELLDDAKKLQMLAHAGVECEAWWRQVEQDFQRLKCRLLAHEHAENRTLSEAYNRDIGAGD